MRAVRGSPQGLGQGRPAGPELQEEVSDTPDAVPPGGPQLRPSRPVHRPTLPGRESLLRPPPRVHAGQTRNTECSERVSGCCCRRRRRRSPQLRVSGNNLLNICKLVFQMSRSERNDGLFQESSIIGERSPPPV